MKIITCTELQQALNDGRVYTLYDNRGPDSFSTRHIKGAQQLSVDAVRDGLPADVNAMLVFY